MGVEIGLSTVNLSARRVSVGKGQEEETDGLLGRLARRRVSLSRSNQLRPGESPRLPICCIPCGSSCPE